MQKTKYFWTDVRQAIERLQGSVVLLGDSPVMVEMIGGSDASPIATVADYTSGGKMKDVPLDSKEFKNFRKLPPTGWVNHFGHKQAVLLERRPVRTRTHGLTDASVAVFSFARGSLSGGGFSYRHIYTDKGYLQACKDDFPPLDGVLSNLKEDSALAVSSTYAVFRDEHGLRWLYRLGKRVGLFTDNSNLLVLGKFKFLKEELNEAVELPIRTIKEF
jgi:hypothetical protein